MRAASEWRRIRTTFAVRRRWQALWAEVPDAITNSQRIAEMCELNLDFSRMRLPEYPVPGGISADEYLAQICHEALNSRIPNAGEAERARLDYELEVIRADPVPRLLPRRLGHRQVRARARHILRRARQRRSKPRALLPRRNRCQPASLQPRFERFLNVERKEMPDIDMDFQDDRREEVINYVVDKYGREHVAQIITFGTFGAKAAIRDVGRALAMPYGDVDRVARLVPNRLNITLEDALEQNPEMKEIYDADEGVAKLVDTAMGLEGLTRHTSTHAAAVLISQEPLDDIVPLQRPTRSTDDGTGVAMTQYAMDPCAALGLLKMDFLGLANLSILARARDLIDETRGFKFALTEIPLEDGNTFDLLSRGDTVGVFQLEGGGMTRYIKELKPSSLSDVAAMIALYRPGPMEHISTFIDSKHGRVAPHYPHPALQDILEETYGVIVYQDQVLQIARTFAGYSLGQADIVRKAMGKKIPEIMAEEKQNFLDGALNQGYTRQMAEQIFALIEPFAGYAFNKAHSVSYGLISYWTAYLKANFPAEYMVALLNSYKDNTDRVAGAVAECRRMNINVLPPSINGSEVNFSIDTGEQSNSAIRFGLSAIKNVGEAAVAPLIETRKEMDGFRSIEQLCQNADLGGVGKKALESLIRAGAFDDFGDRSGMLEVIDRIVSLAQSEAHLRNSQQTSMFDMMGDSMPAELASIDIPDLNTSDAEKGQWEQELLGVSTSNNAMLNLLALHRESDDILMLSDLDADMDGNLVTVTGSVRQRDDQLSLSCFEAQEVILPEDTTHHANNGEDNLPEEREDADLVSAPSNGTPNNTPDDTASYRQNPPPPESVPEQVSAAQNGGVGVAEAVTGYHEDAPTDIADTPPPQAEAALSSPDTDADRDNDPEEDNDLQEENNDEVALPQSPVSGPAQGTNGHARQNGNGASSLPSSPMNANSSNANSSAQADEIHRLLLRIIEGEPEHDKRMLYDVRSLLMEYRGDCEVTLEITTAGHIVEMEWPAVRVSSGTELVERLNSEVLGEFGEAQLVAAAAR
ncbi:DNA polymerase III subunit alpha [Geodia barretti]|uniref:DNA-directed DNA polymerase n=1 Tax=Geodia barretti TaxID=519541 RepID=A0AA35RDL3_GEOBA|nr:DNA polymerase III subunit alpha [Geodia barretti]